MTALADARRSQRQLAERIIQNAIPPTIILAAVIVAMLASVNVRERRNEIGVLCAHGYGKGTIAGMILTRAILIGLIGAALGWIAGTFSGAEVADRIIGHGPGIPLDATLLVAALVLTPALTALVSLAPAIVAASSDPARLMRAP